METPYCANRRHKDLPMCLRHTRETMRQAILDGAMPWDCLRELVQFTDSFIQIRQGMGAIADGDLIARFNAEGAQEKAERDSIVYYIRLTGDRIKIGWTTDLNKRLVTFRARAADVLAIEPGGRSLEAQRHRQFGHCRIGRSEDFNEDPALLAHIESLRVEA
jgi:hypothetical protein